MQSDCDVALLGTGLAPLVAASRFLSVGKSVLLINPDWDFFQEDSELSFDPLWPASPERLNPQKLLLNRPERVLQALRPEFPGAVELSMLGEAAEKRDASFRDAEAPHVRSRSRVWVRSEPKSEGWEHLEAMYVEASDAGLHPQLLEGAQISKYFPGHSGRIESDRKAVLMPRLCDVDVDRYRNGMLEFLRERLEPERIICGATQIELMPGGIRYYSASSEPRGWRTAKLRDGMLIFWTSRLTTWLFSHFDNLGFINDGVVNDHAQVWEQWSLVSREPLDPSSIGIYEGMTVWAETEGAFGRPSDRLSVLRPGSRISLPDANKPATKGNEWASQESFQALSRLCGGFLKWDKFSIRSMRPRTLFQWGTPGAYPLHTPDTRTWLVCGCDGAITDVVRNSRNAAEILL